MVEKDARQGGRWRVPLLEHRHTGGTKLYWIGWSILEKAGDQFCDRPCLLGGADMRQKPQAKC